jgi:ribosomal protein S27AE
MDAVMIETNTVCYKFHKVDNLGLCPECGAVMNEVDRLIEGKCTYIWLECSKSDCDGQWLQKKYNNRSIGA